MARLNFYLLCGDIPSEKLKGHLLLRVHVTYSVFLKNKYHCLFLLIIARVVHVLLVSHNFFMSFYIHTLDYIFITQQVTLVDLRIFGR